MEKSELLLNPYKEHLKKPYLHGAGTLEIDGVQYSADEYITMLEQENKNLKEELEKDNREVQVSVDKELLKANNYLINENKKLKSDLEWYQQHYGPKPLTTIEEVQNYEGNTIWM